MRRRRIFSKRKKQIQKTIFAPKAHLHSSAKVRYLDFCMSAYSTDGDELQSDRMSGRPAPQTTSTAPQPCPTPTASSATFKLRARPHTAELPTIILGDFPKVQSAMKAHELNFPLFRLPLCLKFVFDDPNAFFMTQMALPH